MTEVAPLTIWAFPSCFELLASFDFAFVVRVGTGLTLTTLSMDKFFADPIVGELGSIIGGYKVRGHVSWVSDSLVMLMIGVLL